MTAPDLPTVIRDNNEQLPLSPFVWKVQRREAMRVCLPTRDASLYTGDYSLPGLERWLCVERKSLPDLWGTLLGKAYREPDALGEAARPLDRFRRELDRMGDIVANGGRAWILIEGTKGSLLAYGRERAEKGGARGAEENVNSILDLLAAFSLDYGVGVQWEGGREGAEAWLGRIMCRMWSQATGGAKARKAAQRGLRLPWLGAIDGVVHDEDDTASARAAFRAAEGPQVEESPMGSMPWAERQRRRQASR